MQFVHILSYCNEINNIESLFTKKPENIITFNIYNSTLVFLLKSIQCNINTSFTKQSNWFLKNKPKMFIDLQVDIYDIFLNLIFNIPYLNQELKKSQQTNEFIISVFKLSNTASVNYYYIQILKAEIKYLKNIMKPLKNFIFTNNIDLIINKLINEKIQKKNELKNNYYDAKNQYENLAKKKHVIQFMLINRKYNIINNLRQSNEIKLLRNEIQKNNFNYGSLKFNIQYLKSKKTFSIGLYLEPNVNTNYIQNEIQIKLIIEKNILLIALFYNIINKYLKNLDELYNIIKNTSKHHESNRSKFSINNERTLDSIKTLFHQIDCFFDTLNDINEKQIELLSLCVNNLYIKEETDILILDKIFELIPIN